MDTNEYLDYVIEHLQEIRKELNGCLSDDEREIADNQRGTP